MQRPIIPLLGINYMCIKGNQSAKSAGYRIDDPAMPTDIIVASFITGADTRKYDRNPPA